MEQTTLHLQGQNLGRSANEFISVKHEQFDAVLNDYNPYFSCIFVPAENRERGLDEFCYAIVSAVPNERPYVVRWLTDEMLNEPAKILAWIWAGDPTRHRAADILDRLDAEEKFKKVIKMRAEADIKEAEVDLAANIFRGGKNKKNYYRHGGVTFK